MTPVTKLPLGGQAYVVLVAAIGLTVILQAILTLAASPPAYQLLILGGLTLLSGSFTVRIPTIPARLSVSETFVFAAAILFGPSAATIIVVLDSLIASLWLGRRSLSLPRLLFNVSAPATAIWAASAAFFRVAGVSPLSLAPQPILSLVFPLLLMALLYFLLNSWLIAIAVGFEQRRAFYRVWRDNFAWLSLNYFSGASVAALLLPYLQHEQHAFIRIALTLLPLLVISYLTFKTALGRVEDAHSHLTELNRLYLSTIETLAMAIDAKDQITHGHIRRVQRYAMSLAERMGITDPAQLRALEAASLLHDMGKLAVPEYILNKPGKLTPAEFAKMKLHASVGADILSAVAFPYPVVPIVRHHHENWDGSGYPDGLRGNDIPIGARILSVVDCFDALTSDRPYRPKLSDAAALQILQSRRGSMYDPLVVDTFAAVHSATREDVIHKENQPTATLATFDVSSAPQTPANNGDGTVANHNVTSARADLAMRIAGATSVEQLLEATSDHLRAELGATLVLFYSYDASTDELAARHALGEHASEFRDIRIPRGQRVSGWVAAYRETILNSDAVLDFGESTRTLRPALLAALSTAVIHKGELLGVLSAYSDRVDAFSEEHQGALEAAARHLSEALVGGSHHIIAPSRRGSPPSGSAEAPSSGKLAVLVLCLSPAPGQVDLSTIVLSPTIRAFKEREAGCEPFFSAGAHDLAILLTAASEERVAELAYIVLHELRSAQRDTQVDLSTRVTIGSATAPEDGTHVEALLAVARRRAQACAGDSLQDVVVH